MAEIYRHTDEDGDTVVVHSHPLGFVHVVVVQADAPSVVSLTAEQGRGLLAALRQLYEPAHGGTVATQEHAVHAEEACPDCSCCTRADCARRYCGACPCTEG